VPVTGNGAAAIISDSLQTEGIVPAQRYVQRFAHNVGRSLAIRPHWSNKTKGGRVLPKEARGRNIWEEVDLRKHVAEDARPPAKRARGAQLGDNESIPASAQTAPAQVVDVSERIDNLVVSEDINFVEREHGLADIDNPFATQDEVFDDEEYMHHDVDYELADLPPDQQALDEPSNVDISAVRMGYEDGELDQFPRLTEETLNHPWAIPPRGTERQFKIMSNSSRVRARRLLAADYPAWEWNQRFENEPVYNDNDRQNMDEARAELRRQLDEGPTGPHDSRRVRARRWYVPGRPPD